jgi:hypothetical protein
MPRKEIIMQVYDEAGNYMGEMGAPKTRSRVHPQAQRQLRRIPSQRRLVRKYPAIIQNPMGIEDVSRKRLVFGMGTAALTPTNVSEELSLDPQVNFRVSSLIIIINRSPLTNTDVINITKLKVGVEDALAGGGDVSAEAFPANALNNNLMLGSAGMGKKILIKFEAPNGITVAEAVNVTPTFYGEAID